jgi:hypothetical protein
MIIVPISKKTQNLIDKIKSLGKGINLVKMPMPQCYCHKKEP